MLFITTSTKGGVGKTLVSSHLLTAYLFNKYKSQIRYIEVDDQNMSIKNLVESAVVDASMVKTENLESFAMRLVLENTDAIIDVGGNLTSTMFLKSINDMGSLRGQAIYFIPLLDSRQDLQNALDTYHLIREGDSASKIVFVLNRAVNKNNQELLEEQFLDFFGRKELDIEPALAHIDDAYLIALNFDFVYNKLARHKKTLVEVSLDDVKEQLNDAIARNREDSNARSEAVRLLYHEKVINDCKRILEKEYKPLFEELRKIEEA